MVGDCACGIGFAPMISLALLLVPPVLLFSLVCYGADKLHLFRLPERLLIPIMIWIAFGIGAGHCLLLSLWARAVCAKIFARLSPPVFSLRPSSLVASNPRGLLRFGVVVSPPARLC